MIISVYGYGKYKTESAVGCAVRAIQNKHKVLFVQFLKNGSSSEIAFFKNQKDIDIMIGEVNKITLPQNITGVDKLKAQSLFTALIKDSTISRYNLIVGDEILPALDMDLIDIKQVELLVKKCNKLGVDLYMTGRIRRKSNRTKIAELSDICTDAHCIRHNFNTHCKRCDKDFPYYYTYCCDCGSELTKSKKPKLGRDY